jgi:serine/threonine-protein kinase
VLDNANLQYADLNGATLDGATFSSAILDSTNFGGINLPASLDRNKLQSAKLNIPKLRRIPLDSLSVDAVKLMLTDRKYYDVDWNPSGVGYSNQFQLNKQIQLVVDLATGLMWQQTGSTSPMTYSMAHAYIDSLNRNKFADLSDWRLPTLEEAMSLIEPEQKNGDWYIAPVFDQTQQWIWTADKRTASVAWAVDFSSGDCDNFRVTTSGNYVRAVR